ncbi:MAG TPA: SDR family oxidoreductase [Candidatus Angelobacter sp.]|nr:SDR family oxidoreductase [Candidatus Angelobacter sp.]
MQIQGKVVVVTGGSNGIGRALSRAFAAQGARAVVIADRDEKGGQQVAQEIVAQKSVAQKSVAQKTEGTFLLTDVSKEADVNRLVENTTRQFGQVDIFCSNAGIGVDGGPEASNADWQRIWEINVMAHVYAARAVLPQMLARKEGYLVQTVSAAGLLSQIGSAPYSVTKHAAQSFAEWLAITYGDQGIRVSALCPQGVRTNMLLQAEFGGGAFLMEGALEPDQVAAEVMKAIAEEKFLILPHPEVARYFQNRANDNERWLRGMRKLQAKIVPLKK